MLLPNLGMNRMVIQKIVHDYCKAWGEQLQHMQCIKSHFESCFCYLLKSHVDFSFGTNDVKGGHHDAKKTVQQIVQVQQEKSQAICTARHENHHPFEVEKQVWLQIIQGRLKGKKLNFVYDRFEIFEKKCKHSFCLSLSPVAYAKNFKWYEPPLLMDKETNM